MLSTVLRLILRATGSVLGTPSTKGLMTLRARPAREGMLRIVIPLRLTATRSFSWELPVQVGCAGCYDHQEPQQADSQRSSGPERQPAWPWRSGPLPAPPLVDRARLKSWA